MLFQGLRGGPIFPGGGGGPNAFFYRNIFNLRCSGGGGGTDPPIPLLDPGYQEQIIHQNNGFLEFKTFRLSPVLKEAIRPI